MKKFFAFAAAALVSASMFAALNPAPTDEVLNGYKEGDNNLVFAIYVDDAIKCDDIVLQGTYCGWPNTGVGCAKFVEVKDYAGWYVACVTDATDPAGEGGIQAKPVQLNGLGGFSWDYQIGTDAVLMRGTASIEPNGNEIDIKKIDISAPVVFEVKSWKTNPCTAVFHTYNVTLISPDCNEDDYIIPAISGGFNGWAQEAMTMNELKTAERQNEGKPGAVFEISFKGAEGSEYKFRSDSTWGKDWSNGIKVFDPEEDSWSDFNGGANLVLGTETELVYDFGDPAAYSWSNCEKPEDYEIKDFDYEITVTNAPVCNDAVLAIVGGFDACKWSVADAVEVVAGVANIKATNSMEFKFLDKSLAGTAEEWANEVKGFNQTTFHAVDAADGEEDGKISIDLKDTYFAFCDPSGVEMIVAEKVASTKFVVNGQLYIKNATGVYNAQGRKL